ncbi:putative NDH-dependent cyclic electron flow 5 [Hibiscus syriacus]|uniref:NDH-dependent cyclic electron flow 5 n=1 Tax=Hibiscus syriacus TaxID=106335 RepID=A0A6A2XQF3_HIBSY|nr:putative NDH-dependent cyclic electron flow 5 [Hibiscus syriacus]
MKALKSYVKDLDSKAIPVFLAKVSETKETGSVSGEYTISLYEVLARVHGVKIVPQIGSIMSTIVKTLASSAGSFPLQQACSKVVPAIAKYGIDPSSPEDEMRHIIDSLCEPLSESVLSSQESLSSGTALCLKALVESDNWRFASDETVNKVCQSVTGALGERSSQTNAHMGLVMALAKCNALIVEAYARLLIKSGLRISNAGIPEGKSQKRFSAIQMINFLMKSLDRWNLLAEVESIMEEMEKFQSDPMVYVKGAAYEALQTAKEIAQGSNSGRRDHGRRKNSVATGDRSQATASLESKTLEYDQRSVNRKLWGYENGGVDVSLKDGLLPELDHPAFDHHELITSMDLQGYRIEVPLQAQRPTTTRSHFQHGMVYEIKGKGQMHTNGEEFHGVSESMSSTEDNLADIADVRTSREDVPSTKTQEFTVGKPDESFNVVPT